MERSEKSIWKKLSFIIFIATIVLVPIFFIPFFPIQISIAKGFLLFVGISLSFLFWVISSMMEGSFIIPRSGVILSLTIFLIVTIFSAIFSGAFTTAFSNGFTVGSITSIFSLLLCTLMGAVLFKTSKKTKLLYRLLWSILNVILLINIFQLFFPKIIGWKIFSGITTTLVGNITSLSIIAGLMILTSIVTIDFYKIIKRDRIALIISTILSLVTVAIIGSFMVWVIVGIGALFLFVYRLSTKQKESGYVQPLKIPIASFSIIIICLFFTLGSNLVSRIPSTFDVQNTEIRPSIISTFHVSKNIIFHKPILGIGPTLFGTAWDLYKPTNTAWTDFSDTTFSSGVSILVTLGIQMGILGIIALLYLMYSILKNVTKLMIIKKDDEDNAESLILVVSIIYLLLFTLTGTPNNVVIVLLFVLIGLSAGFLHRGKETKSITIDLLKDPRVSFFSILSSTALLIGIIALLYINTQKFVGSVYYTRSVISYSDGKIDKAKKFAEQATNLEKSEWNYRLLTNIYINKMYYLINQSGVSSDAIKPEIQDILSRTELSAQIAIQKNKYNYNNWMTLGQVYESLIPLKISGSYENAISTYTKAREYAPKNPSIVLRLAKVEAGNGEFKMSTELTQQALNLKPNYADAYLMWAQINIANGEQANGYANLNKAMFSAPNDASVAFQVGSIYLEQKKYNEAISSFERSVLLKPAAIDSRYALSVAYSKVKRNDDSLTQLNIISKVVPENKVIQNAINNIKSGLSIEGELDSVPEVPLDDVKTEPKQ